MSKAVDILKALRQRLEDDGFDVHLGKFVDPDHHALPLVAVIHGKDGHTTQNQSFPQKDAMQLYAQCFFKITTDDPLVEAIEKSESIRDTIIQRPPKDRPDTLDGLVDSIEHQQTFHEAKPEQSNVGVVDVALQITFYDEE